VLAIKTDGTLWSWGNNWFGRLGIGTDGFYESGPGTRFVPVQVGNDSNWAMVSAGGMHSMAIRTDGTLWGWGSGDRGQVGDGTADSILSPVQIGTDTDWVSVSAGDGHSVGIRADGTLWAWGSNTYGQLGDGSGG